MGMYHPRPCYSLKTLLVVVTLVCIATPFLINVFRLWNLAGVLVVAVVAIPILIELAGIMLACLLDRWAERERKADEWEHLKREDSI